MPAAMMSDAASAAVLPPLQIRPGAGGQGGESASFMGKTAVRDDSIVKNTMP